MNTLIKELLMCHDNLIEYLPNLSLKRTIEVMHQLQLDRQEVMACLNKENKDKIHQLSKSMVIKYVKEHEDLSDSSDTFFEDIDNIRKLIHTRLTEEFEAECLEWNKMLEEKETMVTRLLQRKTFAEPIKLGRTPEEFYEVEVEFDQEYYKVRLKGEIEWIVIKVDVINNMLIVLSKEPISEGTYGGAIEDGYGSGYRSGYREEWETNCIWSGSVIRDYVNYWIGSFFSDDEKRLIGAKNVFTDEDISNDSLFLLNLDEFRMLDEQVQKCDGYYWWLREQAHSGAHYSDDFDDYPMMYAVQGNGELSEYNLCRGSEKLDIRPALVLKLNKFLEKL